MEDKIKPEPDKVVVICPNCGFESLEVTVTNSGTDFVNDCNQHWFEGEGWCDRCKYGDWYGDSD